MSKTKRFLALLGVILLATLYLSTLFFAIFDSPNTMWLFKASIAATILLPVLLYAYSLFYRLSHKNKGD